MTKELQEIITKGEELIKQGEEMIAKAKEQIKKAINKRWRGEHNERYWYAHDWGVGDTYEWSYREDNYRYITGNYFKTQNEAERYRNNLIITQQLKDIAMELNDGKDVDWANVSQSKYSICLWPKTNKLDCDVNWKYQAQGTIYCLSDKFLDKAVEKIGKEELIEYMKGI